MGMALQHGVVWLFSLKACLACSWAHLCPRSTASSSRPRWGVVGHVAHSDDGSHSRWWQGQSVAPPAQSGLRQCGGTSVVPVRHGLKQ
jgi:hypothetical protein